MKQRIPMDDYGIFCDTKDTMRVDSRIVAQMFGKRHDHVLRDIENLKNLKPEQISVWKDLPKFGEMSDQSDSPGSEAILLRESGEQALEKVRQFWFANFQPSTYSDGYGRKQRCYTMTRDGFTLLAVGFNGPRAVQFKIAYIARFNEMERTIKALVSARMEFPLLTENIALIHDTPKPYHFSNECDMLNRLAIGMTAKQFREMHDIPKSESIRPYLSQDQIELIETLQKLDAGLLISTPDFQQRKRYLEWFIAKKRVA